MVQINWHLVPMKAHYFLFNAGTVPFVAFGSVFAKQVGMAAMNFGIMNMILTLSGHAGKIFLSSLADRYEKRRLIFVLSIILSFGSAFFLSYLNSDYSGSDITLLCHDETYMESCHKNLNKDTLTRMRRRDTNGIITCEFICDKTRLFTEEICKSWKDNRFCSFTEDEVKFKFTAKILKKHVFTTEYCVYGKVAKSELSVSNEITFPHCYNHINVNCTAFCDNIELMSEMRTPNFSFLDELRKPVIWILLILYLIHATAISLNFSLSDTICFHLLGDQTVLYGRQRLFGALGFGLLSLLSGFLVDYLSNDSFVKNYSPMFMIACGIFAVDLLIMFTLKIQQTAKTKSVFKDISVIFYSSRVIVFAVWCILTGSFHNIGLQYLFWHLEDMSQATDLHWIKTIQALAVGVNTMLGEIPVYFMSGWILRNVGHHIMMTVILFLFSSRFFLYSIISRPYWVLPIEMISGFTISMNYVLIASYSAHIAMPGTDSTVQAIFGASFEGAGMALGSFTGGLIYNKLTGYTLFRIMSYIALVAGIVHLLIQYTIDKYNCRDVKASMAGQNSAAIYTSPNDAIRILNINES